ncbi:hypothetical protein IAR55_004458 [Kwoniella newhampshirensis]|uniref:C-CAP/cofactor C-like domain-containing protein n=1 Tax=Kwoniella newhampshirensis TaxID=1651941 RepID=A0AAW0YX78_9TREE
MSNGISTSQAGDFHNTFQLRQREIVDLLESSGAASRLPDISRLITRLRGDVEGSTGWLPKYDRARYERRLSDLEMRLAHLRAKERPKAKFGFKARPKPIPSTSDPTIPGQGVCDAMSGPSSSSSVIISTSGSNPKGIHRDPSSSYSSNTAMSTEAFAKTTAPRAPSSSHTIASLSYTLVHPPPNVVGSYTLSLASLSHSIIDLRSRPSTEEPTSPTSPPPPPPPPPPPTLSSSSDTSPSFPQKAAADTTLTSLHAQGLKRCVLVVPTMKGSAMFSDIEDCLIIVGAQQFRMHSSRNTTVLLHVGSLPVIEHSTSIQFGACPNELLPSPLPGYTSKHALVQDFDWVRGGQSPNWNILSPSESDRTQILILKLLSRLEDGGDVDVQQALDELLPSTTQIS